MKRMRLIEKSSNLTDAEKGNLLLIGYVKRTINKSTYYINDNVLVVVNSCAHLAQHLELTNKEIDLLVEITPLENKLTIKALKK